MVYLVTMKTIDDLLLKVPKTCDDRGGRGANVSRATRRCNSYNGKCVYRTAKIAQSKWGRYYVDGASRGSYRGSFERNLRRCLYRMSAQVYGHAARRQLQS